MPRVLAFLLWSAVFCLALLFVDQFFVRIAQQQPALVATRTFYLDFRQRLFALARQTSPSTPAQAPPAAAKPSGPTSIEGAIEREQLRTPQPEPARSAAPVKPAAAAPVRTTAAAGSAPAAAPPAAVKAAGYVYTDASGALQMVETLDQVPLRFRAGAQPLTQ